MPTSCKRAIPVAAALVCSSLLTARLSGDKIKRAVPLTAAMWTVDLRRHGYAEVDDLQKLRLWSFHSTISFLNDKELLATFETHEPVEGLQRRSDPHRQLPFRLHAVVLDASSGRALRESAWGSDYRRIGVVVRSDGSLAVFLGDRIDFYSPEFAPRGELKLSSVPGEKDVLSFSRSPSGETMLIQYGDEPDSDFDYSSIHNLLAPSTNVNCVWVRGESIVPQRSSCEPPIDFPQYGSFAIGSAVSDDEQASVTGTDWDHTDVRIQGFQGPWRELCHGWGCSVAEFVSDDTVLVWGRMSASVVRDNTKTIWHGPSMTWKFMMVHTYSEKARLLAIPLHDNGAQINFTAIAVYDVFERKRVFLVKNDWKSGLLMGLAISPRGDYFIVDIDGVLRNFKLPPRAE